ncbi:MAG: hypothetical protein CMO26_00555 [Thiotrichales bacterium]|nr:hypothetical protein [Thiotrichales bacterium]|tara:strand:- start:383 stop:745 length:363 start_codon:yes stop_codon:yes gene_type:complete
MVHSSRAAGSRGGCASGYDELSSIIRSLRRHLSRDAKRGWVSFVATWLTVCRPVTAALVVYLVLIGLPLAELPFTSRVIIELATGATVFVSLTVILWVMCGRPAGAERTAWKRFRHRISK